jgi:Transmembrane amino acid transporter protein
VLDVERNEKRRRILLTLVWFLASLLIAVFVPDIGKVIALLGSLVAIFIFVFPGKSSMQFLLILITWIQNIILAVT